MTSKTPPSPRDRGRNQLLLAVFSFLVGMYCLWILLLPIFPSQDGPMHLFFVHVLGSLLAHNSPVYEHYYTVRHLLPPYSLYYYLLIALSHVFPLIWADKLVIALTVATLAFGTRYLFVGLGRHGAAFAMLLFPLLLNWPLFMGFVNFTLSFAMGAWALGLWARFAGLPGVRPRVVFCALLLTMTLTHPVPVGLVLIYCLGDMGLRAVDSVRLRHAEEMERSASRPMWRYDLLMVLVIGFAAGAYISLFTVHNITEQADPKTPFLLQLRWLLLAHGLLLFGGRSFLMRLYRLSIYLALVLPLGIAVGSRFRKHSGVRPLPAWLIFAAVLLVALPFIPPDLNHSHLFRDRLMLVGWIAALAAGSSVPRLPRSADTLLATYGAAVAVFLLPVINSRVRPVATRVAEIEHSSISAHGQVGLLLPSETHSPESLLFFDPFEWAGAHYVRRADGVLLNTPWLNLPIIPLGMKEGLLTDKLPLTTVESYTRLREDLLRSAAMRSEIYPITDYVVLVDRTGRTGVSPLDPVLAADAQDPWSCDKQDWFLVCDRRGR